MKHSVRYLYSITIFISFFATVSVYAQTKVGVILPMSGEFARYGDKIRAGLESGALKDFSLIYEDEGCDPKKAVTAYKKLSAIDNTKVLLGPWCGSPQVVVATQIANSDQVAIVGSSTPARVFELSKGKMFSTQHSIEQESILNAQEVYKRGGRKVVILFLENDFSRAHEAAFRKEFKGEVLETLTYNSPDASAMRSLALKIKQLAPDALYIPDAFPLMHGILREVGSLGLTIPSYSVYSAQSDDVLSAVGKFGEGLIYSYPKIDGEALNYFPKLAAEVTAAGLNACPTVNAECFIKAIKGKYQFDESGVLRGDIGHKTISSGKFINLN